MQRLKFITTASREANILAAVATVVLCLKILILNRFQSLFFGAYDLGLIVEAILASVIASYVFYLLVVHIKEQSDREVLKPFIVKHAKLIIGDCLSQISEISKASSVILDISSLSESDVTFAFSKISPYSQAPLAISTQPITYANWLQYFAYHENRGKERIRKLLDQLPFLDAPFVSIITEIDDCTHFAQLNHLLNIKVGNPDLTAWAKPFHEYCLLCRKLNSHLERLGLLSTGL